ncbi:MAG: DEAD/DEAH box helicase [Candidatus Pacebacteria bacterium]|nr:DEAD/DEAH box helicase [Candidatus Paceibacterota bacterium]MBP9780395.1 DEAD/DEAH box helicase [Candidatus Paceibacterota bacterium]
MNNIIYIDIDNSTSCFKLTGDIINITINTRLVFSLKRFGYSSIDDCILIPFNQKTKIKILQDLISLLEKFNFNAKLTNETSSEVFSFEQEKKLFTIFSKNAKNIRNNKFEDNPELVENFNKFQSVLKEKLVRPLYPLQLLSAFHMAFSQNSCNFAVPGAGKTSIVYGAYAYLNSLPVDDPKHVNKILVIGPLSSFSPWEKEFKECFGNKPSSQRLSGDNTILRSHKEQHLFSGNPAELTLINHGGVDNLQYEIISFLKKNKTMVVVDEAHRIKNPEGVWGKSVVEISKEAQARVVLTGTPVPNGYEDLFNLFQFLYPYKYKDILKLHFLNLVDMTMNSSTDSDRVKEFIENISPYFIRIKKKDLKLPPVNEISISVTMDLLQREIYDFVENKYIKQFKNNSSAAVKDLLNKAKLIRLRQASTNPSLLLKPISENLDPDDYGQGIDFNKDMPDEFQDDSHIISKIMKYANNETPMKFIAIKKLLEEKIFVGNGKVIIWTIFIQNAKELQNFLLKSNIKSKLLIGEIVQSDREVIIDMFNNPLNTEFQVIIANPFSVSESISLHKGCHNAIYMERDYNCSNFLQSKDRIHRYGLSQNQETNYYYLISSDSIDEIINEKLDLKVKRMEKIIDDDIPLFSRINDSDETDLIKALLESYSKN